VVSSHTAGRDVLGEVAEDCADRGIRLNVRVIYCHNSRVSIRCPETAAVDVYGDRLVGDLCPANPAVQDYACALTADVCRYDVAGIIGEWLHYRPLVHGHHHERYFVELPDFARTLLGLCFCAHCRDYSTTAGFPLAEYQTAVIDYLGPLWRTGRIDAPPEGLVHATVRLLDIRTDIVAELTARVHQITRDAGIPLTFMDHGGAVTYAFPDVDGTATPLELARRLGIDPVKIKTNTDAYAVLGYTANPDVLDAQLTTYRAALGADFPLTCTLRPMH